MSCILLDDYNSRLLDFEFMRMDVCCSPTSTGSFQLSDSLGLVVETEARDNNAVASS